MGTDEIIEVGIDDNERLYIIPLNHKFPYMYREAVEVHWDSDGNYLYSPKPREWSYFDWFTHIIGAAKIQSCELCITEKTKWVNIPQSLKEKITKWCNDENAYQVAQADRKD